MSTPHPIRAGVGRSRSDVGVSVREDDGPAPPPAGATDTEPMKPALYFRVRHGAQKPEAFSVEPDMTQHLYKNLHDKDESEDEDEKENGKQKKKMKTSL